MKNRHIKWILMGMTLVFISTTACALTDLVGRLSDNDAEQIEEKVNATLTAIASEKKPEPTILVPTATTVEKTESPTGMLSGKLTYPGEFLPPQRVVALDATDPEVYFSTDVMSGDDYEIDVQPGTYFILAFLINPAGVGMEPGFSAGYSQAVLCGLGSACKDHSLVPVDVNAGDQLTGIDPIDWYASDEQRSKWPKDPTQTATGTIQGKLGFPSEFIPQMRIVAFDVHSKDYFYVETVLNQPDYRIEGLPPGTYHVVAYVIGAQADFTGGYSNFVLCGQTVECDNHDLVDVYVYAGQVTGNVDPVDFYAQPGEADWPPDPTH